MGKQLKYGIPGLLAGFLFFWLLGDLAGKHNFFSLILGSISGANLVLWIAQLMGKVKPPQAPGPVTLLSDSNR